MSGLLEGKVAVIYGGGGGIGGGVARTFAREGARVFLVGRTRDTLDAVAKEISGGELGGRPGATASRCIRPFGVKARNGPGTA